MENYNLAFRVLRPLVMIFHLVAIVPTIFRLIYRIRIHRLGWDDWWAFYAMLWTLLLLVIFALTSFTMRDFGPSYYNFIYTGSILSGLHAVWGARLSVAVTIVRLLATGTTLIVAKTFVCLFVVFALTLNVQMLVVCGPPSTTKFLCSKPSIPGYFRLTITLVADLWLIALPAYLLTKMNLSKSHHRLLQTIFACEILVTCIGIVHSVFVIQKNYAGQGLSSNFEVSVSLIVCNLLFLVTYIYRVTQRGEGQASETGSTSSPHHNEDPGSENPLTNTASLSSSFLSTAWTTTVDTFANADERERVAVSEPTTREAANTVVTNRSLG